CELRTKMRRQPGVVVIEECDVSAARGAHGSRARSAGAGFSDGNVDGAEFIGDLFGFGEAAIVANENFKREIVGLERANAGERLAQHGWPIARRHNDGDAAWIAHTHSSQLSYLPASN